MYWKRWRGDASRQVGRDKYFLLSDWCATALHLCTHFFMAALFSFPRAFQKSLSFPASPLRVLCRSGKWIRSGSRFHSGIYIHRLKRFLKAWIHLRLPNLSKLFFNAFSVGIIVPIIGIICTIVRIPPTVPTVLISFPSTSTITTTERGNRATAQHA